ncbi:phosphoadenosine phosphosulfate reductase family protein (plasmid) [Shewanella xiamenensis]|uniref:Phosphoadenosine phosphosulfate reductase family protein n=1 Tax=Shewanella xiamenensis TaxID=332186 RepID=A0ABT6UDI6_9GAMM|nr:phosphoadenosine phosphosulfate reductase family protein [Shewanella xiamenensis]MDI5832507.1 phosphoadenosine phosphosulfate reductase family protein [Shewanella xiamenensis]WHF57874.1 phosphoadenosine phosphosulfate reductase family protein [Shewanella xiamenensis]
MAFDIPVQFLSSNTTVSHFTAVDLLASLENETNEYFRKAVDEVKIIGALYITVVALSFGKDSTVSLLVALKAHMELIDEGKIPRDKPFVVCNIDTGVENHLVQMLVRTGLRQLKHFAANHRINLDIRVGTPPLSKQWAALYLSGLKLISASRLNNDCSVILKLDNAAAIERAIISDYGCENIVTILGSRLSESNKRAASIRKFGNDVSADELIQYDKNDMVFAPIVNWTDDHVWTLLKLAGSNPISKSVIGNAPQFSFATNHRLLHVIYSDSKDGSCPTSTKRILGESSSQGGCGGSARTGCYLCAKQVTDKSAEAQAKMLRHSVISGNILKVRNYVMTVAQNIENRTWLAKAVDHTTGAIALQPNTLDSETIDKLLWLLSQATHDEIARAAKFKQLVLQGREIEDIGYADIINDDTMSELDRDAMASAYLEFAQEPLIKPMSLELALYISAIHSRDGVKLPPYRAYYVWKATEQGERIPYPDVDPTTAIVDEIPDPIMVIPTDNFHQIPAFSLSAVYDLESGTGCDAMAKLKYAPVPVSVAKYLLTSDEQYKIENLSPSSTVNVAGFYERTLTRKMLVEGKPIAPKPRYSKRSIKKVSRKNGDFRVLDRGRTSLDSPSFGERSQRPNLEAKITQNVSVFLPHADYERGVEIEIDEEQNGYLVNQDSLDEWITFDCAERAVRAHDDYVNTKKAAGEHIYYFGGTGAFESLLRHGVIRINNSSKTNLMRIIQRTNYFASLGLLSIDEHSIRKLAQERIVNGSVVNQYRNVSAVLPQCIDNVLTMTEFRSYKASVLLSLKAKRNEIRRDLKRDYQVFKDDPISFSLHSYYTAMNRLHTQYCESLVLTWVCRSLLTNGIRFFDGVNLQQQLNIHSGTVNYIDAWTTDLELVMSMFDKPIQQEFKNNPQSRLKLIKSMSERAVHLKSKIGSDAANELLEALQENGSEYPMWYLVNDSEKVLSTLKRLCNEYANRAMKKGSVNPFKKCFSLNDTLLHTTKIAW